MKDKKKSKRFSFLIYFFILILAVFLIYFIVNQMNQRYTSVATSNAVSLVYDDKDDYDIISYEAIQDGNETTLNITFVNKKTLPTDEENINGYQFSYITTTVLTVDYTNSNYGFTVVKDGVETPALVLSEQLGAEVNKSKESYIFLANNGYIAYNTPIYKQNPIWSWLPTILYIAIIIIIGIFFFKMLSASAGGNQSALDFSKSKARRIDDSKVRFKDVAGCDEEKAEMMELVDYLKNPKKYTRCGAKLPKGFLLVGPPGTGKTLLAKAVAGEVGVPFFSISGSDFVEMFVGAGAGRVRDLFKTAKQNAPCVIFIDEIDAVGRQRGAGLGGGNDEREQTLNQLLVELDGFEENSGIIVIAATNRADVLDPALLRAGRFDRQITVNLPNKEGREAIFKVHARNKKIDPSIDFGQLAKRTVGFSGADIANILNEAAILAVRGNREMISMADIDEAIDRRIAGPAKSNKGMNEKERRQVAYHEAGHAIIGLTLPNADKVRKITIIPRGQTGGHVLMGPEDDRFLLTKSELEAEIAGLLGGRSSEEIFFKDVSTGASNDIERATQIARSMVVEYGMSSLGPIQYEKNTGSVFLGRDYTNAQKNFSVAVADEIDKEVRKIVERAHAEALRIIQERKDDVILIAETLLTHETISEEEISYLLEHRELPKEMVTQSQAAHEASFHILNNAEKEEKANEEVKAGSENSEAKEENKTTEKAVTNNGEKEEVKIQDNEGKIKE